MRFRALACDYDGTLATSGAMTDSTSAALERLAGDGWAVLLVTGRELGDLARCCPRLDLFARVVAENGAVLFDPARNARRLLAPPPPPVLAGELRARGVIDLGEGEVVLATRAPYEPIARETIRAMGLPLHVVLNKGAVMILPTGVDKATGLRAALAELGIAPEATVAVGDAENDGAFLAICGLSVAVANALASLKREVDWVTRADHGAGVEELVADLRAERIDRVRPRR